MALDWARPQGWTRRAFFCSVALASPAAFARGRRFRSEFFRFNDPATEFSTLRLTSPSHTSGLGPPGCRAISRKAAFLVYWSDRSGSPQPYRMDLKTGESEQLFEARDLQCDTLCLTPDDKSLWCFEGGTLQSRQLGKTRGREAYRVTDGWERGPGFSLSEDGTRAAVIETRGGTSRVRLIPLSKGEIRTTAETGERLSYPLFNPARELLLVRSGEDSLIISDYNGDVLKRLPAVPGRAGPAFWSHDGRAVLYLHYPSEAGKLNTIREYDPDAGTDQPVAETSQFVQLGANADESVFVGTSGSVASPYLLLLVRATRRELTICEHRASNPGMVAPVFSPDNRRVFFRSDRHGKPAIYSLAVERLVEPAV